MKYKNWLAMKYFGLALGVMFLVGAAGAYTYSLYYNLVDYPYRDYALPLALVGIALLVLGIIAGLRTTPKM